MNKILYIRQVHIGNKNHLMRYITTIFNRFLNLLFFLFIGKFGFAQFDFVENKGQWDKSILFKTDAGNGSMVLKNNGYGILQWDPVMFQEMLEYDHGHVHDEKLREKYNKEKQIVKGHVITAEFLNANKPIFAPEKKQNTYNNYFIGDDQSKWASNCAIYQTVIGKDIYDGIDIRYYSDGGNLKYDWIVKPGANFKQIAIKIKGSLGVAIKSGQVKIKTSVGEVIEDKPFAYQLTEGERREVNCKFIIDEDVIRFDVKNYNPKEILVIDPTLIFCSFSGSTGDNWGYTATPGLDGSFYGGGISRESGFPVTSGAVQTSFGGGQSDGEIGPHDISIIKLSPNGQNRLFATYIGGNGNEQPHSMIVDQQGNLLVTGRTNSSNFPVVGANFGTLGGFDIVVCKINSNGTSLLRSFKIGGSSDDGVNVDSKKLSGGKSATRRNYGDDARSEINIDRQGNVLLASNTQSANFFTLNAAQNTLRGLQDGVIIKWAPDLNSVIFSTYFGGTGYDACFVLEPSPIDNSIFVAGGCTAGGLPNTGGSLNPNYLGGESDGFLANLSPSGTIIRSTYIGTSSADMVYGVKCDKFGFPYITGTSYGNMPVVNANFQIPGAKQFISKLNQTISTYIYSTNFGSPNSPAPNISPTAFLVDRCQNVYVSGWGGKTNSSFNSTTTFNMSLVSPITGLPAPDGSDFYFIVIEKNANSQLFGSYFGESNPNGTVGDHVDGGTSRFDENGIIYQAVCANCSRPPGVVFPTTTGAWSTINRSTNCNLAMIKIDMNYGGVGANIKTSINSVSGDTIGCVPLTIQLRDTFLIAKRYIWNFGDGSPQLVTTNPVVNHTYNTVGTFRVMLIAEDSSTCNIRDTIYQNIKVGDNPITPNFSFTKVGGCDVLSYQFVNTSTAVVQNPYFNSPIFRWNFGDGSPIVTTNFSTPIVHTFPANGNYRVRLTITDTNFCNVPAEIDTLIRINPLVKAVISTPDKGCAPYTVTFGNNSIAGTEWEWNFDDPSSGANNTSTLATPTHTFANVGTYRVRLIAKDNNTCNKVDTAYFVINVLPKPTAGFNFSPVVPVANTPINFTNTSLNAISYVWNFGDGSGTSTLTNPSYLFNKTDTFKVKLYATNAAGCTDSIERDVPALIFPLLDVPNAFTPGRFDQNSVVRVAGFGIGKMDWRIYNRWGQLVFRTTNRFEGWDGTVKGKKQPMDVYTYTLDVEFTDGKKLTKTGDITLIR